MYLLRKKSEKAYFVKVICDLYVLSCLSIRVFGSALQIEFWFIHGCPSLVKDHNIRINPNDLALETKVYGNNPEPDR